MALTIARGELPEEIIQQVQERLPVKSLMRFTCVSKWWASIIADPNFAKSHYLLASQQQNLSRRLLLWNYRQFESLDLDDTSSLRKLNFPINFEAYEWEWHTINLLGSCNGLVSLCAYVEGETVDFSGFYVWNPSTGFFRNLPAPSFTCSSNDLRNCGFGYVSATDDYKVAFSAFIKGKHIFEIFSWRANSWKRIEVPYFKDRSGEEDYDPDVFITQGIVSNEALHWIERFGDELSGEDEDEDELLLEEDVLVFDLVNEVFRKIELPTRNNGAFRSTALGVSFGGCLSVAFWSSHHFFLGHDYMQLWVMREYNVPESWTKLYICNTDNSFVFSKPLFCWESCIFTLNGVPFVDQLIRFDFQKEKTVIHNLSNNIEKCKMRHSSVIGYYESLLRLPDYQA